MPTTMQEPGDAEKSQTPVAEAATSSKLEDEINQLQQKSVGGNDGDERIRKITASSDHQHQQHQHHQQHQQHQHHQQHQQHQRSSSHRSFSAISKTMVGLGRQSRTVRRNASRRLAADLKTVDTTLVYKVLKPYFWAMRVVGVCFIRPLGEGYYHLVHNSRIPVLKMVTAAEIYCLVVCVVFGANFVRSFAAFGSGSGLNYVLSFKLTWAVIWYEGFARALFSVILWRRRKEGFQELFVQLDNMFFTDGIIPYEMALRKMMYAFIVVSTITVLLTVSIFGYGIFVDNEDLMDVYDSALSPYVSDPATRDPRIDYFVKSTVLALFAWSIFVTFLYMGFFVIVCYLLYKEFEYLSRTFQLKITDDGTFTDDLERFRIKHQDRCKMVEYVDNVFKHFIANTYLTEITVVCLLLYTLLLPDQTSATRAMGAFWMTFLAAQTIIVSVASIAVNTQAHSILSFIYSIKASNASKERQLEINMFLNKLTGTCVGLTAWDMFTINKPTMLMIIGLLLSFFFILMQVSNPLQAIPTAICNCSVYARNGDLMTHVDSVGPNSTQDASANNDDQRQDHFNL